ncbi:hypothetical protein N7486_008798 [Penicillium sp. IBT 16267x]|nr:hypothetical protein N7486_008798 [Penicillium sp. IBT 16267x]
MKASLRSLLVLGLAAGSALAASSNNPPKITKQSQQNQANYTAPYFPLLGFEQYANNPVMKPDPTHAWESAYLYNPSAIVMDDKVFLLYRAQDQQKTSSIGLAWSSDGYNFTRYDQPIVYATEPYEQPGGCEDPRVVRIDGTFYLTYTAYDGKTARLWYVSEPVGGVKPNWLINAPQSDQNPV